MDKLDRLRQMGKALEKEAECQEVIELQTIVRLLRQIVEKGKASTTVDEIIDDVAERIKRLKGDVPI